MFEDFSLLTWLSAVAIFAIGGVVGYIAARQTHGQYTRRLEDELAKAKLDLSTYRGQVERHFLKTSALFGKLTDNYREVYEHLAYGAQTLSKEGPSPSSLNLPRSTILPGTRGVDSEAVVEKERQAKTLAYDFDEKNPYSVDDEDDDKPLRPSVANAPMDDVVEAGPVQETVAPTASEPPEETETAATEAASEEESEADAEDEIHLGVESASGIDFTQPEDRRGKKQPPFH